MPKINLKNDNALNKYIKDLDIDFFITTLSQISKNKNSIIKEFNETKQYLSTDDIDKLKLAKLLYCLNYYPTCYLTLGIIIENMLNNVMEYAKTHNTLATNIGNEQQRISKFLKEDSIGQKGKQIESLNLFNDSNINQIIASRINTLAVLRNYGGHSNFSAFINAITTDVDTNNREISDAFLIIKYIYEAFEQLQKSCSYI